MQSHWKNKRKLILQHQRRLQGLKEKQALYGLETPVSILTEIEDIESEIENLTRELEQTEKSEEFKEKKPINVNKKSKVVQWWVWGFMSVVMIVTVLIMMLTATALFTFRFLDLSSTPTKPIIARVPPLMATPLIPPSPTFLSINTDTAISASPSPQTTNIPPETPTETKELNLLESPSILETEDRDLKFLCRESPPEDYQDNIQNPNSFSVSAIYKGETIDPSNLVFDIILSNNSDNQRALVKFEKRWCYHPGVTMSMDTGNILTPVGEYIVRIPIDPSDSSMHESTDALYPPHILAPKSENGPSKEVIRLQLFYYFDEQVSYKHHPSSGWDIYFDLYIVDDSGERVKVFAGQSWRSLSASLSEKSTNAETGK